VFTKPSDKTPYRAESGSYAQKNVRISFSKKKKKKKKKKWSSFLRDKSLSETRRVPLWSFFWLKMGPLNAFFGTQKRLSCVNKARKQNFGVKIGVLYRKSVLELIVML